MALSRYTIVLLLLLLVSHAFSQSIQKHQLPDVVHSSFRGLSVVNDSVAWVSGNKGWVGHTTNGGKHWAFNQIQGFEGLDFRTLFAFNDSTAITANAGSPGYILRTTNGGQSWQTVYTNNHTGIFMDGVDFWNDQAGVIYGDPIEGRMFLLFTTDGGKSWQEPAQETRPKLNEGEASFAASGTGIRCYSKSQLVIATGGKTSRLFLSDNRGQTWRILTAPVQQGKESAGIFSVAFHKKRGVVVGGDFVLDSVKAKNSFYTRDGGKTWRESSVAPNGYRESVEFISAQMLITTGPTGTEYSADGGNTWISISTERGFHAVRKARHGNKVFIVGNNSVGSITF
ncbi:MAG: photosystem II stability/assembly factor-like protein [Cyclobacteriaceae bacterium]|nr:photosystem II stability/assembly factor-like protein [Cyclobacteriaceae bacterium]